jgi:hypothetical protein
MTRSRRLKTLTPKRDYRNSGEYTLVLFDLRVPGSVERLHSERAAWREHADIELLDFEHAVLVVRPGTARRLAS